MEHLKKRAAIAALVWAVATQASAEVKIGFTGVMSGPGAAIGQDQYDGFMLAVEQLDNKLGGQPVTVLREDDQLKPEIAIQAVRKLLEREKVDAIVGLGYTNVLMAALPTILSSGKVAIATNAGPRALSGAGCKANFFSTAWQSDGPAESMGVFANQSGYKSVYLMAPNYQAGKEMLEGFKRYYEGKVADEVYVQLTQADFSAEIAQLQFSGADALFFFAPGGLGINFVKQMRQAGVLDKMPTLSVFSIDATTLPALKAQAKDAITGAMWDAALDLAESRAFAKAFQIKYNRPASMYAAVAYDAANLLNTAIAKLDGDVSDQQAFARAVKEAGAEFKSVRGHFEFNNNHMPIQNFYAFKVVENDTGVEMDLLGTTLEAHKDTYYKECSMS